VSPTRARGNRAPNLAVGIKCREGHPAKTKNGKHPKTYYKLIYHKLPWLVGFMHICCDSRSPQTSTYKEEAAENGLSSIGYAKK